MAAVSSVEPSSTTIQDTGGRVWAATERATRSTCAASLRMGEMMRMRACMPNEPSGRAPASAEVGERRAVTRSCAEFVAWHRRTRGSARSNLPTLGGDDVGDRASRARRGRARDPSRRGARDAAAEHHRRRRQPSAGHDRGRPGHGRLQRRDLQLPRAARRARRQGPSPGHPAATRRRSCTSTRSTGSTSCAASAGCSRSRCGTSRAGASCSCATAWASSRCTTRRPPPGSPSRPRSRP